MSHRDRDATSPAFPAGGKKWWPHQRFAPACRLRNRALSTHSISAENSVTATARARPFSRLVVASKALMAASALQRMGKMGSVEGDQGGGGKDGSNSSHTTTAARRWALVRSHFFKSRQPKHTPFVDLLLQKKEARDRFEHSIKAFNSKNPR